MAYQQTEDKVKTKQERTKAAIALAMQSRWTEAVAVNRSLIDDFPGDLESHNRMGRALTELGRIDRGEGGVPTCIGSLPAQHDREEEPGQARTAWRRPPSPSADPPPGNTGLHRRVRQDSRDLTS